MAMHPDRPRHGLAYYAALGVFTIILWHKSCLSSAFVIPQSLVSSGSLLRSSSLERQQGKNRSRRTVIHHPSLPFPLKRIESSDASMTFSDSESTYAPTTNNGSSPPSPPSRLSKITLRPVARIKELATKIRQSGSAGLVALGIINAIYYTTAVSIVWGTTGGGIKLVGSGAAAAPIMIDQGFRAGLRVSAGRFLKVFAVAWAGSQVTKPFRLGGALVTAPTVSRFMIWVQGRLGYKNKRDTVPLLLGMLMLMTGSLFGALILQGTWSDAVRASLEGVEWASSIITLPPLLFAPTPPLLLQRHLVSTSSSPNNDMPLEKLGNKKAISYTNVEMLNSKEAISNNSNNPADDERLLSKKERRALKAQAKVDRPKRRPKKLDMPPNPNIHGWDQHPSYLRGKWNMTMLEIDIEKEGELPAILMEDLRQGCKAMILRRDAVIRLREGVGNLSALGWEFTPANRRVVFEISSPSTPLILRFSGEVRRKPKHWCRIIGSVRVRPEGSGRYQPHRTIPSSDPSWPTLGHFTMDRFMSLPIYLSKLDRLLIWCRLEAPRFRNTKAGRKAEKYMAGSLKGEEEWNAKALKYELWRYFDADSDSSVSTHSEGQRGGNCGNDSGSTSDTTHREGEQGGSLEKMNGSSSQF